ncbi:MAG: hypothetical protein IJ689_06825 [Alphaproteobacteria bacterium]|nr:hypothetical protein [Alphaproteobacteria bacterium]
MNKYILLLGVAAVSIGSYAAYAGNSATMTVTATIAHDVSLGNVTDINLGTITINPAYDKDDTVWQYSDSRVISLDSQGAIVSAPNATIGTFTANVPEATKTACNANAAAYCGELHLVGNSGGFIDNIFGGSDNACSFNIKYSGTGNTFNVFPKACYIEDVSVVTTGAHSGTLTISYTAS